MNEARVAGKAPESLLREYQVIDGDRMRMPEANIEVRGFKVDMLWREARLVVELDGTAGHGTNAQKMRDHDRDLTLRRAGCSVLRYSWGQVTQQGAGVAADARRALQGRP